MTEKPNAYSYLRISTDQQKVGDGLRRQMELSRLYAEKHGFNLLETLSDVGISAFKGKNAKDGALGLFIEAIDEGNIEPGSILIIESLDRLSRDNVLQAFNQFSSILTKGIEIVTLADEQHYTEDSVNNNVGQLFTSIGIMLRANDESVTKSKRLKEAWENKRKQISDKKLTSIAPAWLKVSKDRTNVTIDESKANTVRKMFNLAIEGVGKYALTRHLNENLDKYPPITNAKKWNPSYVSKILNNHAVYGEFQPNRIESGKRIPVGEPIEDYYPAIITKDTFNLARERIDGRRIGNAGRKGDAVSNLFSGIVKCSVCGGTLIMRNKGKPPKGYRYLRCSNSLVSNGCDCPSWRYSEFEDAFIRFVRETNFSEILNDNSSTEQIKNLEAQRATLKGNHKTLTESYNALLRQFENPALPEKILNDLITRSVEIKADVEKSDKQINELDKKIASLTNSDIEAEQTDFLAKHDELKKTNDLAKLREIRFAMVNMIKRNIDSIVVHNDMTINPWEVDELLSSKLLNEVAARGYKTTEQLEDYFSKPHGKRLYVESERFFVVKFKNEVVRVVTPYQGTTFLSVSERLLALKKGN